MYSDVIYVVGMRHSTGGGTPPVPILVVGRLRVASPERAAVRHRDSPVGTPRPCRPAASACIDAMRLPARSARAGREIGPVLRRAGNTLSVPGFPLFTNHRTGSPANLRWLSITVDGVVTVHTVSNRIGCSEEHGRWFQWRLVHEVSKVIDPECLCAELLGPRDVVDTPDDGVVVSPHRPGSRDPLVWPENRVATAMLDRIGVHRLVRGTVAWLGDTDLDSGLYADLSRYRIDCLRIMAAQAHAHVMTVMYRSAS